MTATRISAEKLVDWVDQALLHVRVGGAWRERDVGPDRHEHLRHLRRYGIRTATDLVQAYEAAVARGGDDPAAVDAEVGVLREALALPQGEPGAVPTGPVPPIQLMVDTLADEEWFTQIRNWRSSPFGRDDAWYRYLDGTGWDVQVARRPAPPRRRRPVPVVWVREAPPAAPTGSPGGLVVVPDEVTLS
jgi:hypothetical protein